MGREEERRGRVVWLLLERSRSPFILLRSRRRKRSRTWRTKRSSWKLPSLWETPTLRKAHQL